ncbi:MAG TPA: hypothetical protein DD791_09490 [Syntrophomonas sp.]|nr:hypothetical protein [Syntrophomonas sp.]
MREAALIIKYDLLAMRNNLIQGGLKKAVGGGIGILVTIMLAFFIASGGYKITRLIRTVMESNPKLMYIAEFNLITSASLAIFVLLLLAGFRVIYQNFYESEDLFFLLATPLSTGSIFGVKFLHSFNQNLLLLLPFTGALWVGYGLGVEAPPAYYFIAFLTLLLANAIFTALASLLLLLISGLVSSQKMKQFLTVGSMLLVLVIVLGSQYYSSLTMRMRVEPGSLLQVIAGWNSGATALLPHIWISKSLLLTIPGFTFSLVESLLPLILLTLVMIWATLSLAKRSFISGWSFSHDYAPTQRSTSKRTRRVWLFGGLGGIVKKDLLTFKRLPLVWYNLLVVLIIMGFMGFNLASATDGQASFARGLLLFMLLLITAQIGTNLSAYALSMEGGSWWVLQQSPLQPAALYRAKLLSASIPSLLSSGVTLLVLYLIPGVPMYPWYFTIPVLVLSISLFSSLCLLLDIYGPNFEIGLPQGGSSRSRRSARSGKTLGAMFLLTITAGLVFALLSFSFYAKYIPVFSTLSPSFQYSIGIALFLLAVTGGDYICYQMGKKQLANLLTGKNGKSE